MIVNTKNKKEFSSILRFYRESGYPIKVTFDDWYVYKENTCINIEDDSINEFSSLAYYKNKGESVVDYKTFVEETFQGDLEGFPLDVITAMVIQQKAQGNLPDYAIFEHNIYASKEGDGFTWGETVQGQDYWANLIKDDNFEDFNFIKAARIK